MVEFKSCSLSHESTSVQVVLRKPRNNESPSVSWYVGKSLLFRTWNPINFSSLEWSTNRTTVIRNRELSISTPEHLSAALLLWHHLCAEVYVSEKTRELPLLDGSARSWIEQLRPKFSFATELLFYDVSESFGFEFPYGFCEVTPSDTFEVEYSLEQEGYADSAFVSIYAPEDMLSVLNARTFIFEKQYEQAKAKGMLSGVSESSGLLLQPLGKTHLKVLNGEKLRFPQEIIYHKVLDLVGDITLLVQELPKVKIRIHNGGHAQHHQIFKRLVKYVHSRYSSKI